MLTKLPSDTAWSTYCNAAMLNQAISLLPCLHKDHFHALSSAAPAGHRLVDGVRSSEAKVVCNMYEDRLMDKALSLSSLPHVSHSWAWYAV